jgi:hypothetical protein
VRRFVTARGPTGTLGKEIRVIDVADENMPGNFLFLEVALQTKSVVALIQHSLVDGAVR